MASISRTVEQFPLFTHEVKVKGQLHAAYQFTSKKAAQDWIDSKLPALCKQYGPCTASIGDLTPLRVGDSCYVVGEALDVFVITSVVSYGPHSYGFLLDSGCVESVSKCSSFHPSMHGASAQEVDIHNQLQALIATFEHPPTPAPKKQKKIAYLFEYKTRTPLANPSSPDEYKITTHSGVSTSNPRKNIEAQSAFDIKIVPVHQGECSPLPTAIPDNSIKEILTSMLESLRYDRLEPIRPDIAQHLLSAFPEHPEISSPLGYMFLKALFLEATPYYRGERRPDATPLALATLAKLPDHPAFLPLKNLANHLDFKAALAALSAAQCQAYDADIRDALT